MMHLAEYRKRAACLADFLPWAALVAPGIVFNKDGSFLRCARFRGPDLDSSTESELTLATSRINNALKRLRSGWALFVEANRREAQGYPESSFPDALSWLIDEERRGAFEEAGSHFESRYTLTLVYLPPAEVKARASGLLYESPERVTVDWRDQLAAYITETDRFLGLLEAVMPEIRWLDDGQILTYLHSTVSTRHHPVALPEVPFALDALLTDEPFTGGLAPVLGDAHLRIVTVRGLPASTWPGMLDELNRLGFGYRWMTRFVFLDKAAAIRELTKIRRQWFAKRKGIMTLLRETIFQQESPLVDSDAANKAVDADAALQELGSDAVGFGYITASIVVADRDPAAVEETRKAIERVVQGRGFIAISETLNAVEAWLGSIPGHTYANVRQGLVSTVNLAHLIPLSAVWAGLERNEHLGGPPLIVTRTEGSTPFRLVTHVGDVGHTLIVGPTGAGKSVLLATLILQFRRYPHSQVLVFDKGRSVRATVLGLAGEHYDLGADGAIAFQPLAGIDDEAERAWAADWIAGLLHHEEVPITPEVKEAVWSALGSLASAPRPERTLTGLSILLQSNRLRQALQPYTLNGPFGRLLDAEEEHLGAASVQAFEMEELMHTRSAVLPALTYLFHRLEERFNGAPTLLVLDEAWVFLDDPVFAGRIREWLKTLRKKNVSVIFATQSLADIQRSSIAPALIESCPTRIFLPSPQATEPQLKSVYEGFGLNDRQIDILAHARPKRDYYYQSRLGCRLFDLGLGPVALAFAAASTQEDQRAIDEIRSTAGSEEFAAEWLAGRGLDWAARLIEEFPARRAAP
ncbi:MAG: conjugal transfer protein TrbE [Steroidobacteraceae bacterium]